MSAKSLELDHIHLTSSLDKVRLSVSTTVDILFPGNLALEENQQNIDLLESGILWVVRGPFCSLDFFLAFDQMLDVGQRVYICESLGYQIRDAPVSTYDMQPTVLDRDSLTLGKVMVPAPNVTNTRNHSRG